MKHFIFIAALFIWSSNAFAVDCNNPPGGIGLDSAQENLHCAETAQAENDNELNNKYKKLLRILKNYPEKENFSRTQIVVAQRAWVAFQNAECDFETSLNGGAHQWLIVNQTQCLSQLTAERVKVLEKYLQQATEN
jgi:uncharacterized protein YecT (DUF1311 family)